MGKSNTFLSIIIPIYNEEKNLRTCLNSISKQTYINYELIIIDDGSKDRSSIIARSYSKQVYRLNHGGPGRAKNFAAKRAKGKILVFVDADMILDKDYLYYLTKPIIERKCYGTFSTAEYVLNNDNIWSKCFCIDNNLLSNERIKSEEKSNGFVFRAILRNKFLSTPGFDISWGYYDDGSLQKYGLKSYPVNNAICYHNNPDTLIEVFISARWIGRSNKITFNLNNIFRYSIINSIRISVLKIISGAPISFIIYKVIFDLGILSGILRKHKKRNYSK